MQPVEGFLDVNAPWKSYFGAGYICMIFLSVLIGPMHSFWFLLAFPIGVLLYWLFLWNENINGRLNADS